MMASEAGGAQPAATPSADPNSLEKYPAEGIQGHAYQYYPTATGSAAVSWPAHVADHSTTGNITHQNLSYQFSHQPTSSAQDVTNASSLSSATAAPGTENNTSNVYSSYATYPTSNTTYGYGSSEYTNYYTSYQQQPNQSYPPAVGAYQNSGSPYQPISSFQNTGSYAGPTSYSSTYYNPGDYQTTGAYTGGSYSSQTNSWSQGNYTNYTHQYANYSQDSSSAYSTDNAAATASTNYQQQYKQWADYYNSQTEVTCAPGTENMTATSTSVMVCPIPSISSGYVTPVSQPQPSYAPAWKPEPSPSTLPSAQAGNTGGAYDDYWKHATQVFQNQNVSNVQSNYQKTDVTSSYPGVQDQQKAELQQMPISHYIAAPQAQLPNSHYTSAQMQQTYQQPLQPPPPVDMHRVSKLQIAANPRITSNLAVGVPKSSKDPSSVAAKPAYVSVSVPKPIDKVLSSSASESSLSMGCSQHHLEVM